MMKKLSMYISASLLAVVLGACEHDVAGMYEELNVPSEDVASRSFVCTVQTQKGGELEAVLDEACSKQATVKELLTELTVVGPLSSEDLNVIKPFKFVKKLDLSQVMFHDDKGKVSDAFPANGLERFESKADVILPSSVKELSPASFRESGIVSVRLPEGIQRIGQYAFDGCKHLKSINFPATVTEINRSAFDNCMHLMHVDLPDHLTTIGSWAFAHTSLTTLVIPDSVQEIGGGAFAYNPSLKEIQWPLNTQVIPEYCFQNCSNLKFEIPGHITKIRYNAFEGMNMQEMVIPSSVQTVENLIFKNCKNLAAVFWNTEATIQPLYDGSLVLIYASQHVKAEQSVMNVVRGDKTAGYEAEEIFLSDKIPYYVPVSFKAKKVAFAREFRGTTDVLGCANWNAMSLPFKVSKVYAKKTYYQEERLLKPFGSENMGDAKPFWLSILSQDGFKRATVMEAGVPYLIAFPNNPDYYLPEYNIEGEVVFCGEHVTLPTSVQGRVTTGPDFDMHPNFSYLEKSMDCYNLNQEQFSSQFDDKTYLPGSVFRSYIRVTNPYEAYVTSKVPNRAMIPVSASMKSRVATLKLGELVVPSENDIDR